MKKNNLLRIALVCGKLFVGFTLLALLGFTVVFVHWHVRPEAYKGVMASIGKDGVEFSKSKVEEVQLAGQQNRKSSERFQMRFPSSVGKNMSQTREIPMEEISRLSLYFMFFQFFSGAVILLFIVHELLNVIRSVRGVETFHTRNVQSFRRIGSLCLVLALLEGIYFLDAGGVSRLGFSIEFTTLLFMLGAFVMAEVFKEGNSLFEQDQLTI